MDWQLAGIVSVLLFFLLLGIGIEVGFALGLAAVLGMLILDGGPSSLSFVRGCAWSLGLSFTMVAAPLFIFMGQIIVQTGLSRGLFEAMSNWFGRLPGGLAVATVMSCTVFAAISGSSSATAGTIGMSAIPEMRQRGYDARLALGTVAGSGTLGILIPPSLPLIIYGSLTDVSVAHLFIAGVAPGIAMALLFSIYILVRARLKPSLAPSTPRVTMRVAFSSLFQTAPVVLLIVGILGGLYLGVFTATEAAAIGCVLALAIAFAKKALARDCFLEALKEATRVSSMIMLIIFGALLFGHLLASLQVPQGLTAFIIAQQLPWWAVVALLCGVCILLGTLIEAVAILLLTIPLSVPLILSYQLDLTWWAVVMIICLQTAQITPPVGLNLFVTTSISGHPISEVVKGAMPFFLLMLITLVIVIAFPELSLWLPGRMG